MKIPDQGTWVHPPGRQAKSSRCSESARSVNRPTGWRLPLAIFVYSEWLSSTSSLSACGSSVWWCGKLPPVLLPLDGLHIVQSRSAMLYIFLTTFITAGILFLGPSTGNGWVPLDGSWAMATPGFGVRLAVSPRGRGRLRSRRRHQVVGRVRVALRGRPFARCGRSPAIGEAGRTVVRTAANEVASFLLVVPLGAYLLSYGSFFFQHGPAIHDFITLQMRMLRPAPQQHHIRFQPENSRPWTWPLLLDSVRYFRAGQRTLSLRSSRWETSALWWGFLTLLSVGLFTIARRPTW